MFTLFDTNLVMSARYLDDVSLKQSINELDRLRRQAAQLKHPRSDTLKWFKLNHLWITRLLFIYCKEFEYRFDSKHQFFPKDYNASSKPRRPSTDPFGDQSLAHWTHQQKLDLRQRKHQRRRLHWTGRSTPKFLLRKVKLTPQGAPMRKGETIDQYLLRTRKR